MTYTVAQACSDGTLKDCACDATLTAGSSKDSSGKFDWTGCSDNIDFGVKIARQFIDAKESSSRDARGLMNLHNNSAGRRVGAIHRVSYCTRKSMVQPILFGY